MNMNIDVLTKFSDEIIFTIDEFTAQLCCSPESKKIAYRFRYNAYYKDQLNGNEEEQEFVDNYDQQANSRTHLIWYQNRPIATVRSAIWSPNYNWDKTEAIDSFWYAIHRKIGLQQTIIESNRFATAPNLGRRNSLRVQLLLFRIIDLNAQYEESNHIITVVRKKHIPFYERMLNFSAVSDEKYFPFIDANAVLMASIAEQSRATISSKGMKPISNKEIQRFEELVNTKKQLI